jgi:hypothetical protein
MLYRSSEVNSISTPHTCHSRSDSSSQCHELILNISRISPAKPNPQQSFLHLIEFYVVHIQYFGPRKFDMSTPSFKMFVSYYTILRQCLANWKIGTRSTPEQKDAIAHLRVIPLTLRFTHNMARNLNR